MGYVRSIIGPVPSVSRALYAERAVVRVLGYTRTGDASGGGEQVVDDLEGNGEGRQRYQKLRRVTTPCRVGGGPLPRVGVDGPGVLVRGRSGPFFIDEGRPVGWGSERRGIQGESGRSGLAPTRARCLPSSLHLLYPPFFPTVQKVGHRRLRSSGVTTLHLPSLPIRSSDQVFVVTTRGRGRIQF